MTGTILDCVGGGVGAVWVCYWWKYIGYPVYWPGAKLVWERLTRRT